MKTSARFLIVAAFVLAGMEYVNAQAAARSSKEVISIEDNDTPDGVTDTTILTLPRSDRGIPTPPYIEKLLADGKISEALNEFEKFKTAQQKAKANPYHLLYCEMTIYQQAQMGDPANSAQYAEKIETLRQEIIKKYPNVSDTYILLIDNNTPDEKIVELTTKAIELDPDNISAYDYRGHALFNLGRTKEACQDFEKLPRKNYMPEYWPCKDLK